MLDGTPSQFVRCHQLAIWPWSRCCFILSILLSAPTVYLVFSMIAHSLLCGLAHFKAAMSPGSYGPLFASVLGVTVPKGSVHDARLLVKG